MGQTIHKVRIQTGPEFADVIMACAELVDLPIAALTDVGTGTAVLELYETTRAAAERRRDQLTTLLPVWSDGRYEWTLDILELPDEDWAEKWKESFHARQLSPRIVVKPPWEDYDAANGVHVIDMDPGLSFGTGLHPTTRACIHWLDALADTIPGASMLDAGCGSGILSIAAAMLGYEPVVGFDCDPVAVECARENCRANGTEQVQLEVADLDDYTTDMGFGIIAANIRTSVLRDNAERLLALLAHSDTAQLLLAGILTTQYDGLCRAFETVGLTEAERITENEWTCGRFTLS